MSPPPESRTTLLLRAGLDVLTFVLATVVLLQRRDEPLVVVLAVALVVVQVAGRRIVRPQDRPLSAGRARWWPDGAWLVLLAALWLGLLATAGAPAIWLAFPMTLVQMHVLGPRTGIPAVLVTTAVAIGAGLSSDLQPVGAVLGPILGAALAIAVVVGLEAVLREAQTRQDLIDRLVATQRQLAEVEHDRGVAAERERLAREVHDTLAQGFSSIELLLRVAEETGDTAQIARARQVARDNLTEARAFVRGLAPADLTGATLDQALARIADRAVGFDVDWRVVGPARPVPVAASTVLVRAAQSALANVEQHARASRAELSLEYLPASVRLRIEDDGVGVGVADEGFGLATLRARVEQAGGRVEVHSQEGRGTTVTIEVPA